MVLVSYFNFPKKNNQKNVFNNHIYLMNYIYKKLQIIINKMLNTTGLQYKVSYELHQMSFLPNFLYDFCKQGIELKQ